MSSPLGNRVPIEYTAGGGRRAAQTARTGRGVQSSFITSVQQIGGAESVQVTIPTPSLSSGQNATVSATQGLSDVSSVNLAQFDTGRMIFVPTSVTAPTGLLPSHPQVQITSAQGVPVVGELASGQSYSNLAVKVSVTVYALTAVASGSMTVEGHALLIGGVLGD